MLSEPNRTDLLDQQKLDVILSWFFKKTESFITVNTGSIDWFLDINGKRKKSGVLHNPQTS